ncbi:MAG: diphosphate--fructose-6-phosphate 1-phosphotransferase [Thermotoga sp.]|nr:MAG: diphosphate--fructose-6-phosphate 1-phosphotransferase [Thermotoga sp.]
MSGKNIIYAQSGGVTSVINCSAYGVLKTALGSGEFEKVFVSLYGVTGLLKEEIIDLTQEDPSELEKISRLPGGFFGSCRKKLRTDEDFELFFKILDAHDIGYFFYNGGNDSMLTAKTVKEKAKEMGYDLKVVGIPKTIDNDLMETDFCPGYPTTARFNAITFMESTLDVSAMHRDSTKVFIMETMGRHAGWIVASTSLFLPNRDVQIILFPEVPFDRERFLEEVEKKVEKFGYCVVAVSEGIRWKETGDFVSKSDVKDEFGHEQLGKVGIKISNMVENELKLKTHVAILDYVQRSARHSSTKVDVDVATSAGSKAVKLALEGIDGVMVNVVRKNDEPYLWELGYVDLEKVGGSDKERKLPKEYMTEDGFNITEDFVRYALPFVKDLDVSSINPPCIPKIEFKFVKKKVVQQ